MTCCSSIEDFRRKVRRVDFAGHIFVNGGERHVARGGIGVRS